MNYRNPAFAPAYGGSAPAYGAMAPYAGYGITAFGAEPTFSEKVSAKLDEETLGVKNKYLLGGAVLGAGLWWAYANGYI